MASRPRYVLPTIIAAQFAGVSLWFAVNAVIADLSIDYALPETALGSLTSSVQLGFIVGTLLFATTGFADRFSPRLIFLVSCAVGAGLTLLIALLSWSFFSLLVLRAATGICLGGIYPIGMKIASGWYKDGLGTALGWLVGALVLGTAFPYVVRAAGTSLPWREVLLVIAGVCALGGASLYCLVPDGPNLKNGTRFSPRAAFDVYRSAPIRRAAFGYFGHMWELYAFWTIVPLLVARLSVSSEDIFWFTFAIIAIGFISCGLGGELSRRTGSAFVARAMLAGSCIACLASPFALDDTGMWGIAFLLFWGATVVGDSPQFSALVASAAPAGQVGTALTLTNSLGFALTIPSIELLTRAVAHEAPLSTWLLLPGPLFGLWSMRSSQTATHELER